MHLALGPELCRAFTEGTFRGSHRIGIGATTSHVTSVDSILSYATRRYCRGWHPDFELHRHADRLQWLSIPKN